MNTIPESNTNILANEDERLWASRFHLGVLIVVTLTSMFAGVAGSVTAIFVYLYTKSSFIKENARESFNFNFTMFLLGALAYAALFVTFGLAVLIVWPVTLVIGGIWIYCTIKAYFEAKEGKIYRFPLSIRFL